MKSGPYLSLLLLNLVHLHMLVSGRYIVTVELLTYDNPTHSRAQSKDCCEADCSSCDNRFTFCFSDNKTSSEYRNLIESRPEEAAFGCQYATGLVAEDSDSLTFQPGQPIDEEVPNPLVFSGHNWTGRGTFLAVVYDVDTTSLDDTVDAILVPISCEIGQGFSTAKTYTGIYTYGKLKARFRVDCDEDFYGQNCTVHCKERDNEGGHYVCDSEGNKTCIEGYRNVSSECSECVPAAGCSTFGGFCTKPGECICHSGYSGENCTYHYISSSETSSTAVYILSVVTGFLTLLTLILTLVMVALCAVLRKKRVVSVHKQEATGEYVNEGLGPNITAINNTEYSHSISPGAGRAPLHPPISRQYDTIDHRVAAPNQDATTGQSASGSSVISTLPMLPNVAYNVEL